MISLPPGWHIPNLESQASLWAELHRELSPQHPLYRERLEVIGASDESDSIFVRQVDRCDRVIVVHLTWRGRAESDPTFPAIEFDGTMAEFVTNDPSSRPDIV